VPHYIGSNGNWAHALTRRQTSWCGAGHRGGHTCWCRAAPSPSSPSRSAATLLCRDTARLPSSPEVWFASSTAQNSDLHLPSVLHKAHACTPAGNAACAQDVEHRQQCGSMTAPFRWRRIARIL